MCKKVNLEMWSHNPPITGFVFGMKAELDLVHNSRTAPICGVVTVPLIFCSPLYKVALQVFLSLSNILLSSDSDFNGRRNPLIVMNSVSSPAELFYAVRIKKGVTAQSCFAPLLLWRIGSTCIDMIYQRCRMEATKEPEFKRPRL